MTKINEVYRCNICGNIVEVLHTGVGQLVCCGKPMELLQAKTEDEGKEKHVPVIEKTDSGIKVKVGSVPHPMEQEHYIEWIEIFSGDKLICRKTLSPGEGPEAEFSVNAEGDEGQIQAREYCSVHGLWKSG